ncbi:MAG: RNA pseudouridine synthase, partial [Rikenellaceae bacterium]
MFTKERILFEDNHLMVVNKLSGELVQSDTEGNLGLEDDIKEFIKIRDNKPGAVFLGVIHRIDRPVSGAIIFAKTSKALARMNENVKAREIKKHYLAIVEHAPQEESGTLKHYIVRNSQKNRSYALDRPAQGGKEGVLNFN